MATDIHTTLYPLFWQDQSVISTEFQNGKRLDALLDTADKILTELTKRDLENGSGN